jgi:hypothetical protein
MKFNTVLAAIATLAAFSACHGGAEKASAHASNASEDAGAVNAIKPAQAVPDGKQAAASPREPQEILCNMGRCTYLRIDEQENVRETNGERLIRVRSAEGAYPVKDGDEFPTSSRGLTIQWDAEPTHYYVLCSTVRPLLIRRKEGAAHGWEGVLLDLVDGINFADMDLYVHYSAACHPGEKVDAEGFAAAHGYRKIEGDVYDLAKPEDAFTPRA